ncbi:MAG: magnesium transporter [Elusimicrobia bacterium]|nr:magnesium transporter [Elusimicrobiota bacterium]
MSPLHPSALFVPEIKQLLAQKDYRELKQDLLEINPADLAEGWDRFTPFERIVLFKLLPIVRASELFEELDVPQQAHLFSALDLGVLGPILEELGAEAAQALFHRLPERTVRRMATIVRRAQSARAERELVFPPHTAGSLMHTDILNLGPKLTAQQALDLVRASSRLHRMSDLHVLYVTDEQGRLMGVLTPRSLIAAPRDMRLSQIMGPVQLIKVRADLDQEEAAKVFSKYKLLAAPVVDQDNRLLGVLTVDDILHVISQEATEDIAKMAGTTAEELEDASAGRVARLRMPWLIITCLAEVGVSAIVRGFEHTLAQAVALASFMPLIAAMGGNVGAQSSTLCVRGLATGHIQPSQWRRMALRELRAGIYMGLGYGFAVGLAASVIYWGRFGLAFPLVVGVGVLFSMTVASTMGSVEPFVLHHFKMDPAVAVGPLVSTMTDLLSVTAYLSLATAALSLGWLR